MSQLKSQTKQNQGIEAMRQGRKVPKTNLKLSNVSHEAVGILSKREQFSIEVFALRSYMTECLNSMLTHGEGKVENDSEGQEAEA